MSCPQALTGKDFLLSTLAHVDCQAQALGSYGYVALSSPGSAASVGLTALLTLFVALFGIRLLFGPAPDSGDAVREVLKVAIVLTLALSWPAWKTLGYDLVMRGPAEIADSISPATLPYSSDGGFAARLQNIDTGIIAMTVRGTGRNIGALTEETSSSAGFREIALQDDKGLASARLVFLASTIGSLAAIRFTAGLLLALAPLAAGLLLFVATRGLFGGWLRGLVLTMLGSVGITVVLAAEVAVLEPWLQDAIRLRDLGYATPSAPTELLALTAGFALALAGTVLVLARVAFQQGWQTFRAVGQPRLAAAAGEKHFQQAVSHSASLSSTPPSRAFLISERVAATVRHEEQSRSPLPHGPVGAVWRAPEGGETQIAAPGRANVAGSSRTVRRVSSAARRRDARS